MSSASTAPECKVSSSQGKFITAKYVWARETCCRPNFGLGFWSRKLMKHRLATATSLFQRDLRAHYGCVNAIEFSCGTGEMIASGGDDRRILVWNVEKILSNRGVPATMKGDHNSNIFCLAFDNQNKTLFSGGNDEQVLHHDLTTGETKDVFMFEDAVYGLSVDPNNQSIFATASEDGKVLIYDVRSPPTTDPFCLVSYSASMHSVMYNPIEPRLLATANAKEGAALWDIRKAGTPLLKYGSKCLSQQNCMNAKLNCSGDKLLVVRRRMPLVLYNVSTARPICEFDQQGYYNSCTMKSCSFAGDRDQYVVSGSDDFNLYMWRIPDDLSKRQFCKDAHMILHGHRSIVNQVRFNPVKHLLISSGVEKVIKVWSPFELPLSIAGLGKAIDFDHSERPLFTHEEYVNLVLRSGQVLSHDYSHMSTDEDPRMIAFFDSLVQREVEGWSSEDDIGLSSNDEELFDQVVQMSRSLVATAGSDSSNDSASDREANGIVGGRFSPFTVAYASVLASQINTTSSENNSRLFSLLGHNDEEESRLQANSSAHEQSGLRTMNSSGRLSHLLSSSIQQSNAMISSERISNLLSNNSTNQQTSLQTRNSSELVSNLLSSSDEQAGVLTTNSSELLSNLLTDSCAEQQHSLLTTNSSEQLSNVLSNDGADSVSSLLSTTRSAQLSSLLSNDMPNTVMHVSSSDIVQAVSFQESDDNDHQSSTSTQGLDNPAHRQATEQANNVTLSSNSQDATVMSSLMTTETKRVRISELIQKKRKEVQSSFHPTRRSKNVSPVKRHKRWVIESTESSSSSTSTSSTDEDDKTRPSEAVRRKVARVVNRTETSENSSTPGPSKITLTEYRSRLERLKKLRTHVEHSDSEGDAHTSSDHSKQKQWSKSINKPLNGNAIHESVVARDQAASSDSFDDIVSSCVNGEKRDCEKKPKQSNRHAVKKSSDNPLVNMNNYACSSVKEQSADESCTQTCANMSQNDASNLVVYPDDKIVASLDDPIGPRISETVFASGVHTAECYDHSKVNEISELNCQNGSQLEPILCSEQRDSQSKDNIPSYLGIDNISNDGIPRCLAIDSISNDDVPRSLGIENISNDDGPSSLGIDNASNDAVPSCLGNNKNATSVICDNAQNRCVKCQDCICRCSLPESSSTAHNCDNMETRMFDAAHNNNVGNATAKLSSSTDSNGNSQTLWKEFKRFSNRIERARRYYRQHSGEQKPTVSSDEDS